MFVALAIEALEGGAPDVAGLEMAPGVVGAVDGTITGTTVVVAMFDMTADVVTVVMAERLRTELGTSWDLEP